MILKSNKLLEDINTLQGLFSSYRKLLSKEYKAFLKETPLTLKFLRIQGSPDAYPASLLEVKIPLDFFGLKIDYFRDEIESLALTDYFLRILIDAIKKKTKPLKGFGSSGSFQIPDNLSPEIIKRNIVFWDDKSGFLIFWLRISLPARENKYIYKEKLKEMLFRELPEVFLYMQELLKKNPETLSNFIQTLKEYFEIENFLKERGYVAFIANGSILPRESGISQRPYLEAKPFKAPKEKEIEIPLKGYKIKGLAIPKGVTIITGAGYHGKSTLLNALVRGIYPHIPGDGREKVVTRNDAVKIKAEDGRPIHGIDVSYFIESLPNNKDIKKFFTQLASGSTSQAASFIEYYTSGTKLFLLDEDDSATNFLMQDKLMKQILSRKTIIPLSDKLDELKNKIDLILVCGGSSEYLKQADTVIEMVDYEPLDITDKVLTLFANEKKNTSLDIIKKEQIQDHRKIFTESFNPEFYAKRFNKVEKVRIKSVRGEPKKLEYGNTTIDLTAIETLIEPYQVEAIGWLLYFLYKELQKEGLNYITVKELKALIEAALSNKNLLRELSFLEKNMFTFLSQPRIYEVLAAINRMRNLKVEV